MREQDTPKSKSELARDAMFEHLKELYRLAGLLNVLESFSTFGLRDDKKLAEGVDDLLELLSEKAQTIAEEFDGEVSHAIMAALPLEGEASHA